MRLLIIVYDVTRRETFLNLAKTWAKEVERFSTIHECVKILVGNKVDKVHFISPSINNNNTYTWNVLVNSLFP